MDIRTFHRRYIEGQTEEPWADAFRRLCAYRHDGSLTRGGADGTAPMAAWTIWHEPGSSAALGGWMPWGGQNASAPATEWAWRGTEPTPQPAQ